MSQIDSSSANRIDGPVAPVDIAIVGGGMVGLTLACALGGSDLSVVVIDPLAIDAEQRLQQLEQATRQGFDPRVSALSLASEQILRNVGAWPTMARQRISPYRRMQVWDGEGTAEIVFSAAEQHLSRLGYIVENRVTLAGLHQALEQHDNLRWLGGMSLQQLSEPGSAPEAEHAGSGCRRTLLLSDGRQLGARLVVAADGAQSPTRRLAGYQYLRLLMNLQHRTLGYLRFTIGGSCPVKQFPQRPDTRSGKSHVPGSHTGSTRLQHCKNWQRFKWLMMKQLG